MNLNCEVKCTGTFSELLPQQTLLSSTSTLSMRVTGMYDIALFRLSIYSINMQKYMHLYNTCISA